MAIPKRSRKGLQSIMTHADRSIRAIRPHRAFMRVSAIELEKARRQTERIALVQRMREIDQRCRDLDSEKNQLLLLMGERQAGVEEQSPGTKADAKGLHNKNRSDRKPPKSSLPIVAGSGDGRRFHGHPSKPKGSKIARMLKTRKPEPLRPLPEWGGKGLRIKY